MQPLRRLARYDSTIQAALTVIGRLSWIDSRLRSAGGLHLNSAAGKFRVSTKTIYRDVQTLRQAVGPTKAQRQSDGTYLHRYTSSRPRRLL
jgi:predicted DNA-binding transcriptional regulator YafY